MANTCELSIADGDTQLILDIWQIYTPYFEINTLISHNTLKIIITLKGLGTLRFFYVFKRRFSPSLHLCDQKYSKNSNIVKYYYNLKELFSISIYIFLNVIYSCDVKLYFQHHFFSFQCHMIFRNHSNMMICCSRNISYVKIRFCCLIFYHQDSFRILWWIESSKQHLFVTL